PDPVPARQARRSQGCPCCAGQNKTEQLARLSAAFRAGRARLASGQERVGGQGTEGFRRPSRTVPGRLGPDDRSDRPVLAWQEGGGGQSQQDVATAAGAVLHVAT